MGSDVVDVFTIMPSRGQANSEPTSSQHAEIEGDQPTSTTTTPMIERPNTEDHEPAPQEMIYKIVKRNQKGRIASAFDKDGDNWEAAKAVMG